MKAKLDELRKALSQTDITGKLVQEQIDKVIQSLIRVDNPLYVNLPKKPGQGEFWYVNQRSANPAAEWVLDTDSFSAAESTYDTRLSFQFKTIGVQGQVTRKAQAIGRAYTDIKSQEIAAAVEGVKLEIEDKLITGDATGTPAEFDGLEIYLPTGDGQVLDMGTNGGALTLEKLDQAIDLCYGSPNMIIASRRTRRELNALMQANQRYVDVKEVKGGFKLPAYSDIPIFVSRFQIDTQTKGTSTAASSLYILDTSKVFIGELSPLTMKAVESGTTQYDAFEVYTDLALVVSNKKYCARMEGIISP